MKTTPARFIVIVAAFMLAAMSSRADAISYAQILKERDSVLSQILAQRESRRSAGLADEDAIAAAKLALYSFRRDVAATTAERVKNQELIIRVHERKLEYVKAQMHTGLATGIDVLAATASLLEAKQVWEELHLNEKQG